MSRGNRRACISFSAVLLAALGIASCGGGGDASTAPRDPTPTPTSPSPPSSTSPPDSSTPTAVAQAEAQHMTVNPAIVAADNGLGLALFQTLQPSAAGNIAISPLSIAVALQILYNGAAGTTQQAMAATTVTIAPTAVPVSSFTMTLDRPFLYAIRDGVTGSLLFIGALMNPSAS